MMWPFWTSVGKVSSLGDRYDMGVVLSCVV